MWYIEYSTGYITIYRGDVDTDYFKLPAGSFMLIGEPDGKTISFKRANDAPIFKALDTEIASPAKGLNDYETYLEKLAIYMSGDPTVVF